MNALVSGVKPGQVGSYLSLGHPTRRIAVKTLGTIRETEAVLSLTETSILRNMATRERFPGRITDVRYVDLINSP